MSNTARHIFTEAESKRGQKESVATKRTALKIEKLRLKNISRAEQLDLLKGVLSNPLVIGTLAYFVVDLIEKASSRQLTATEQNQFNTLQSMVKNIPIFGGFVNFGFANGVQGTLGYAELKMAILAYIATGGNVAGSLANLAGVVKSVIP